MPHMCPRSEKPAIATAPSDATMNLGRIESTASPVGRMVRLAYRLVVMIMVGVTDRHSADEYDDTEPGNIEIWLYTRIRRALPRMASPGLHSRCNFTTWT